MQYRYGMRLRGFSPGCQPMSGLDHREDDKTGRYHDILVYNRPLTAEEVRDYELDNLDNERKEMPKTNLTEEEKLDRKRKGDVIRNRKYMQKVRQVMVKFNLDTDERGLFEHVSRHDNMQGYIKELIRKDMENSRVSKNEE